jgi:hypothetical protein
LRDISKGGAQLLLDVSGDPSTVDIPGKFILSITPNGNVTRRCQLIWRRAGQLGVRFEFTN